MTIADSACTSSRFSPLSRSYSALQISLGVGKNLGRDIPDPNWPKGYSIPYKSMLSNKNWGKARRVCSFSSKAAVAQRLVGHGCACGWEVANDSVCIICFLVWVFFFSFFFFLCLWNSLYLEPLVSSLLLSLCSPPSRCGWWRARSCAGAELLAGVNPPCTVFFFSSSKAQGCS